ncbi:hypothetical protein FRC03_006373, partial [Tulasnella sp. 419]
MLIILVQFAMSNPTDALNDIFDQYNDKLSHVVPQSVAYNVGLFTAISLGTVIVFNILRPNNK